MAHLVAVADDSIRQNWEKSTSFSLPCRNRCPTRSITICSSILPEPVYARTHPDHTVEDKKLQSSTDGPS